MRWRGSSWKYTRRTKRGRLSNKKRRKKKIALKEAKRGSMRQGSPSYSSKFLIRISKCPPTAKKGTK